MRRFRLNIILSLILMTVSAIFSLKMYDIGKWAQGTLLLIAAGSFLLWHLRLIRDLIRVISMFMKAIETDDMTIRFNIGEDDKELRKISWQMNQIISLHRKNVLEVQTAKLYYDRILRVMTHEMGNAITPVIAISSDIEKHPDKYDPESMKEAMQMITSQGAGIKRFLDSYYNLTHIGNPEKKKIAAADFLKKIRQLAAIESAKRNLREDLVSFSEAKGMELEIDEQMMTQVLVNLIRNSIDAVERTDNPKITVSVFLSEGSTSITVSDNGCGIDPKMNDYLFQPFMSSKAGGTGVGLALSRQIVRKHGGELTLTNRVPHGAEARITI